ncbi:hypothetical protein BY458DRAFT_62683 [Sporodiniella umbellata]|nr:hypothetical protein BY458DRAFT_62683 [Sporodiniella umbellata]
MCMCMSMCMCMCMCISMSICTCVCVCTCIHLKDKRRTCKSEIINIIRDNFVFYMTKSQGPFNRKKQKKRKTTLFRGNHNKYTLYFI